jgi:RNA recognition motif-containing protein
MNIYVGFLPDGFNDELLKEKFAEFGEVVSAKVIKDRDTGLSKGFGFVEMKNQADGQNAIETLKNWVKPDGRTVKVNEAQERTSNYNSGSGDRRPKAGSGSGGFGGGRKW